jgi:hypothetical protein
MNQAMMVTKIGALHWTTVAREAPIMTTALFQKTWKIPMLMAPMPINQGRSFFLTISSLGLMIRMPKNSIIDVVRSRQKARPTADKSVSLMIRLMNIPEVAQHAVAVITVKIPESLVEMGFLDNWANVSSLED